MPKQTVRILSVGLGALFLLSACSSQGTSTSIAPTPSNANLTIWVDSELADPLATIAEQVMANTGDTLTIVEKDFSAIEAELASSSSVPDLFVGSGEWTDRLAGSGLISSLGESELAGFEPAITAATSYRGELYAIPYAVESLALVCNGEKVSSQPRDLNALTELGFKFVVNPGGDPYTLFPVQSSFGVLPLTLDEFGDWQAQSGLGDERSSEFATWIAANRSSVIPLDYGSAMNSLADGTLPCLVTGPWSVPELERSAELDIRIFDIPSVGGEPALSFGSSRAVFVSASTPNLEAAKRVAMYFATEPTQRLIHAQTGRIPAMSKLESVIADPITKGFIRTSKNSIGLPVSDAMQKTWGPWSKALNSLSSGAEDPALIWDQMLNEISKAIG